MVFLFKSRKLDFIIYEYKFATHYLFSIMKIFKTLTFYSFIIYLLCLFSSCGSIEGIDSSLPELLDSEGTESASEHDISVQRSGGTCDCGGTDGPKLFF